MHFDFEIQTDYLNPARRSDFVMINQKKRERTYRTYSGLYHPSGPQSENQNKKSDKRDKLFDNARERRTP